MSRKDTADRTPRYRPFHMRAWVFNVSQGGSTLQPCIVGPFCQKSYPACRHTFTPGAIGAKKDTRLQTNPLPKI